MVRLCGYYCGDDIGRDFLLFVHCLIPALSDWLCCVDCLSWPVFPSPLPVCTGSKLLEDFKGRKLIAFGGEWSVGFLTKHNPGLVLDDWLTVSK